MSSNKIRSNASPSSEALQKRHISETLDIALGHPLARSTTDLKVTHPTVSGNWTKMYAGRDAWDSILSELKNAQSSIHITQYAFSNDSLGKEVSDVLMAKAKAGVEVRLQVEAVGSKLMTSRGIQRHLDRLRDAGVDVIERYAVSLSVPQINSVEHRKFFIIDGKVGFTGGMGVQEKYRSEWHDTMVRLEGPIVHQMQTEFVRNWAVMRGNINPQGRSDEELKKLLFPPPTPGGPATLRSLQQVPFMHNQVRDSFLKAFSSAKESIVIETPYFTDEPVLQEVIDAAKRGVDVHLILPEKPDIPLTGWSAKANFERLMDAGVHIYLYPGMTHAKLCCVDGQWATVGTSNVDPLSLIHNHEYNIVSDDEDFVLQVEAVLQKDLQSARKVSLEEVSTLEKWAGRVLNNSIFSWFL